MNVVFQCALTTLTCTILAAGGCTVGTPERAFEPVSLAGSWRVVLDDEDVGLDEQWFERRLDGSVMSLPGTTDLAKLGEQRTEAPPFEYHLTREYAYEGAAWYQRAIDIPASWRNRRVELMLERVMWQSMVWVNGRPCGTSDSLSVAHRHDLGRVGDGALQVGRNVITLRVDNRMIHPIGDKGHAYGDQMQSKWNGVAGRMELRCVAPGDVVAARLFPDAEAGTVAVALHAEPLPVGQVRQATITLTDHHGEVVGRKRVQIKGGDDAPPVRVDMTLNGKVALWSEFDRPLYEASVSMDDPDAGDRVTWRGTFGFRTVGRAGQRIAVNGRPVFMRGNLECGSFPLTGHPPTDKASWLRIWRIYAEHNLNHARFHAWCPPRAAFEAADEMGIYLQVEAPIWMDTWMMRPNARPEMDTEGHPQGLGWNDRGNDAFTRAEIRRILDEYGNHPSFVLFCVGNELGSSNFDELGAWMAQAREYDPRHLYAASTARTITEHCQYNVHHHPPGLGPSRARVEPSMLWDYEAVYGRTPVPVIAHETGQVPVYPEWRDIRKYTGPLRNFRLEAMREQAIANGIAQDDRDLRLASGRLHRILNRDEIESFLRTPSCAGFQLLGMQDFAGQGEAYVGWLDTFYDSKGTIDAEDFAQWCAPTVPLLKLPARTFTNTQTFEAEALLHHSGAADLDHVTVYWRIERGDGSPLASGEFQGSRVTVGEVRSLGWIRVPLKEVATAQEVRIRLWADGMNARNAYPVWVFPDEIDVSVPDRVVLTDDWSRAKAHLAAGERVLYQASRITDPGAVGLGGWRPLYWSSPFFPGQTAQTLGLLVRHEHPAFDAFPTEGFNDWQWYDICRSARGFDLTGLVPDSWKPIAQPVPDFHQNRKLATLFELRVGKGALLVCGYDLDDSRAASHPEVAQLRRSLLQYVASDAFAPALEVDVAMLDALFPEPAPALTEAPQAYQGADLYIRAAGRLSARSDNAPVRPEDDHVLLQAQGVSYRVEAADGAWRDEGGSAWHGRRMRIVVQPRAGVPGTLHLRLHDWNRKNREGHLIIEGRRFDVGPHVQAKWITCTIIREDTNDGELVIEANATQGPNLMITDLVFVPEE